MATNIILKNNARSTLLAGITSGATNLSVQSGHGARFSAPVTGEIAKLTLYDSAGNIEICHGITRSGDGWSSILRAQEGTTARAWNAGDGISENATADFLNGLSQLDREETATAKKTFSVATSFTLGLGPSYINNIGYTATVASKALTVARKTQLLVDPTASTPTEIGFRNRTETTGNSSVRQITSTSDSSFNLVLPNGATLGFSPILKTVTMTIASPCVLTDNGHGRLANDTVIFTTTGALPTGLTAGTVYYILAPTTNTYNVSATPGGAAINTSGTQSGVHTASYAEKGSIYIYECDDGGTRRMAFTKKAIFDESRLHNTTAISATSDADNVLYTNVALTNAAVRLTGRIDITTGAVAGEWDNNPTRVALWTSALTQGPIILAEKAQAVAGIGIPSVTFNSPVNVQAGDMVELTLTLSCIRNAADFYGSGSVTINSGTAVLESTGLTDAGMAYGVLGEVIHGTQRINHTFSGTYKVATAGTITTLSANNFTFVGTVPTNQLSYLRAVIVRPNL